MTHLHEKKPANERRISVDQPSLRISISFPRHHTIQFFPSKSAFLGDWAKTHKKRACDFETHVGKKQKLSLIARFSTQNPIFIGPKSDSCVVLKFTESFLLLNLLNSCNFSKSHATSSCVVHHQTLFNLRSWLSLRKSMLVQLSKLSKSLVKIMKLKFC